MLYSAPDKAMGSKPIGRIVDIDWHAGKFFVETRNNGERHEWAFNNVRVLEKLKPGGWVVEANFGRTNAPRYWLKGNFLKKIAGVFERQGVYGSQANIHWERDEGGLWAVMRVAIKDDPNARTY